MKTDMIGRGSGNRQYENDENCFHGNNPNWRRALVSVIAVIVFVIIGTIAFTQMDGMNGGFALAFVSLFLSISSVAIAGLFVYHARVMDAILNNKRVLAHWSYPEAEARRSAEREYHDYRERNSALFIIVGGMLGLVAVIFCIFVEDGGVETALILFAVLVIIYLVSRVAPKLELKRALSTSREAYIAENGIIYEGAIYPFRSFLMKMVDVTFHSADVTQPSVIVFSFTQIIGFYLIRSFEVRVPVPGEEEKRAREIVQALTAIFKESA